MSPVQQTIRITREIGGNYRIRFPDGDYSWQPSKDFAQKAAEQWFREHGGRFKIEWLSNAEAGQ